jgi:hypothetical protein
MVGTMLVGVLVEVVKGLVYGQTRAMGEVRSRVEGNKVMIAAEREHKAANLKLALDRLDLDRSRLGFEVKRWREQIELEREKMHAHSLQRSREIAESAEVQKIYEHHPLRLTPRTFQRNHPKGRVPLHVILVPPKGPGGVDELRRLVPELEDGVLDFVDASYHALAGSHPVKLLTEAWIPGRPCGSAAVEGLFGLLEGAPMLIVEAVALSEGLGFRIGFWGLEQTHPAYARIGTVPYAALVADPDRLPADHEAREAALRAETLLGAARLLPWYRLILAVAADQFHLLQSGAKPSLPRLLPAILGAEQARSALEDVIAATLDAYRQIYGAYAVAHGPLAPDLLLDLAEALIEAGRMKETALVVGDAEVAFLALRKVEAGTDRLAAIERAFQQSDAAWIERLAVVYEGLGETAIANRLRALLARQLLKLAAAPAAEPGPRPPCRGYGSLGRCSAILRWRGARSWW